MGRPKPAFRVTLEGAGRLEDLPIAEVADFLRGIAQVVSHGAAEELNRPRSRLGRPEALVEEASHLRLVRLKSGSVVAEILPPHSQPLPGSIGLEAESLTERAFRRAMRVAAGNSAESPSVAAAFADLLDRFVRHPAASIRFEDLRDEGDVAEVRVADRKRLRREGQAATLERGARTVSGWLYAADMKALTAKVRTAANETIDVAFDREQKPHIKRALDDQASLRGEVLYDDAAKRARSIRVAEIFTGSQLDLGDVDFWEATTLEDLVAEQGTSIIDDPSRLAVQGITGPEWDAFYAAMDLAG
jgi:hypothetical protein